MGRQPVNDVHVCTVVCESLISANEELKYVAHGTCKAWGIHHFKTFDDIFYTYPKKGEFVLVHNPSEEFKVIIHTDQSCEEAVCPISVTVSCLFMLIFMP